jgi:phosphate transport system permease protein
LRAAKSGVITGILLAVARVSGETAPLLFTALNNQFFSTDMNKPMANLPVVIYQFALSPYENWVNLAWGGALLITLTVLGLNILARVFFREKSWRQTHQIRRLLLKFVI